MNWYKIAEKDEFRIGVVGYSDQKFDKSEATELLEKGIDELAQDKKNVIIVSGLTDIGIPALAYKIAVEKGFGTEGVACSKADDYDCFSVDKKIIVGDDWGDESDTFLSVIDALLRVGGGSQSLKEVKTFKDTGSKVVEYELDTAEDAK